MDAPQSPPALGDGSTGGTDAAAPNRLSRVLAREGVERLQLMSAGHSAATGASRSSTRRPALVARWCFLRAAQGTLLAAMVGSVFFNISEVRGSSMEPGIRDSDRILIDHSSYLLSDVKRGDVVVLRYPLDPSLDYIKRVIGVPGDLVEMASGVVRVNGVPLQEPYVDRIAIEPWSVMHTRVQAGHVFVLGDNRRRSSDSREFGQVPFENLRGKVRLRVWPPSRLGRIE